MAKSDVIELTNSGGGSCPPCRIVLDPKTQRFLERAEDTPLLSKPTNCDGDEYSLCHLNLTPLIAALGRLFPDIDACDDPDELLEALADLADTNIVGTTIATLQADVTALEECKATHEAEITALQDFEAGIKTTIWECILNGTPEQLQALCDLLPVTASEV